MKIVLVSDIHANLPALEAFLQYLKDSSLSDTPLYFLGDYVNLGPFPEETIQLLRSIPAKVFLGGNHDRYIINERALDHNPYFGSKQGVLHCRWTRDQLSPESLEWLRNLEIRHQTDIGSYHLDMIHGRHGSDEETLNESLIKTDSKILYICGHTHIPRNQKVGEARIYNPGSLGKPLDKDNRASFGILDVEGDEARFEVVRIPYDVERTVRALQDRKVPWRDGIINSLRTAVYTDED
ncbi:MAG TPA: metallophosphoesterase family protein [Treponemataceae bacterium]|nr:metallophosphoesterase family protein [Treponemataceae bacterium]